jgi:Protein of unknown function (DUF1673).
MFWYPQEMHGRLQEVIGRLREKGDISPENTLSARELGFEEARHRRIGRAGGLAQQRPPGWVRYGAVILMFPIGFIFLTLIFLVFNLTGAGPHYPEESLVILSLVILVIFVARMFLWRKHWQQVWQPK